MTLLDRAYATMEMLQRAPSDPTHHAEMRMLREDAVFFFEETLNALDFFEPHFQTYDDLITEARRSWWFRLFNHTQPDGMDKLHSLRRSFKHYLDDVHSRDVEYVVLDPKLTEAGDGWISWRDSELRRAQRGPYR